jgi:hypothetical protein
MTGPALLLSAASLLSKHGFNDGDMPDEFLDWCDQHGHDEALYVDWHAVLVLMVRERLLPAIDAEIDLAEISTSHNPIRARRWNGQNVEPAWSSPVSGVDLPLVVRVRVPYGDALGFVHRVLAAPPTPPA